MSGTIGPLGTGRTDCAASDPIEMAAALAQLGADPSCIQEIAGGEAAGRGLTAAAQTVRLAVINQESGTTHQTLNAAVTAGHAGAHDAALNTAANLAKHEFSKRS